VEDLQAFERGQLANGRYVAAQEEEECFDQAWRELHEAGQDCCREMQGWGVVGGYSMVDMSVLEQDLPLHCETRGQQAIFESRWQH
jgi:hypothetical protein